MYTEISTTYTLMAEDYLRLSLTILRYSLWRASRINSLLIEDRVAIEQLTLLLPIMREVLSPPPASSSPAMLSLDSAIAAASASFPSLPLIFLSAEASTFAPSGDDPLPHVQCRHNSCAQSLSHGRMQHCRYPRCALFTTIM